METTVTLQLSPADCQYLLRLVDRRVLAAEETGRRDDPAPRIRRAILAAMQGATRNSKEAN